MLVFSIFSATAQVTTDCVIKVNLLNQDPYPAVPNEKLKVVFQIEGVSDPSCGLVKFTVIEEFPFSLLPDQSATISIQSGTYSRDFNDFVLAPFEFNVHSQAQDGDNELSTEHAISSGTSEVIFLNNFDINVNAAETDFEVSVKDYNVKTDIVTFEILNIGEKDAEALTIEIPRQDTIQIKGSNRNIVGSLDSNEDATFTYEATPKDGEINLTIFYNDEANTRRSIEKTVLYDSSYFKDRNRDKTNISLSTWFFIAILILGIIIWIRIEIKKKHKKKKRTPLY